MIVRCSCGLIKYSSYSLHVYIVMACYGNILLYLTMHSYSHMLVAVAHHTLLSPHVAVSHHAELLPNVTVSHHGVLSPHVVVSHHCVLSPHVAVSHHGGVLHCRVVSLLELELALSLPPRGKLGLDAPLFHDVHVLKDAGHERDDVDAGGDTGEDEAPVETVVDHLAVEVGMAAPVAVVQEEHAEDGEARHRERDCK